MVEQLTRNEQVRGSSPRGGSKALDIQGGGFDYTVYGKTLIPLYKDCAMRVVRICVVIFVFSHFFVWAGNNGGGTGFDFLRIDTGARPVSMAGAFVSIIGDLHGLAYNPATLVGVRDLESTFTYLNYFVDIKSGFVGLNKTLDGAGHLGLCVSYINYGEIRRTDIIGENLGSFIPSDFTVTAAYSDSLSMGLRYGVSLKYIQSKIDQYMSNALALDIGFIYRISSQDLNIGLCVSNLGSSMKAYIDEGEKLPLTYRLGVSKRLAHLPLLLNFNLIRYQFEESNLFLGLYWALGGEFTITDNFFLRWGYNSRGSEQKVGSDSDRLAGVSLGFGILFRGYRLDYGFSSFGALGSMNTFTVTIPF